MSEKYVEMRGRRLIMALLRGLFFLGLIGQKNYMTLRYRLLFGKFPNLNEPKTFNEKILWDQLNIRNPLYPLCTDKYNVRQFLKDKGCEKYLIPLIMETQHPETIDFSSLPNQFVMKANHGCKWNLLVLNKEETQKLSAIKIANKWLKKNYYWVAGEWQYRNIKPRILIEEIMIDDEQSVPIEYEFFCFHGRPYFIIVSLISSLSLSGKVLEETYYVYDNQWHLLGFGLIGKHQKSPQEIPKPKKLEEMLKLCELLSSDFDHVRVDLYLVKEKIYFGELTFSTDAGLSIIPNFQEIFGEKWKIKELVNESLKYKK